MVTYGFITNVLEVYDDCVVLTTCWGFADMVQTLREARTNSDRARLYFPQDKN